MMASGFYASPEEDAGEFLVGAFFCAGAWAAGRLLRHRVLQVEAERAAGGELARAAVAEERARIARELHDVVAHGVSIVAVQAGAAETAAREGHPTPRASTWPRCGAPRVRR